MEDLTVERVEAIHTRIIAEEKGDYRVLSEANLLQMVFSCKPHTGVRAAGSVRLLFTLCVPGIP